MGLTVLMNYHIMLIYMQLIKYHVISHIALVLAISRVRPRFASYFIPLAPPGSTFSGYASLREGRKTVLLINGKRRNVYLYKNQVCREHVIKLS